MKERVAGSAQSARAALHVDATIFAEGRAAETGQVVEMKIDIVCDHEIDEAIAIVVAEGGAGRPAAVGDAGFCRHVSERAVAVVAIEDVATKAGEVEIGPAVVVVVSHRAAHGKAGSGQPGFRRDVGEGAVVIVVVKSAEALACPSGHDRRLVRW